MNKIIDLSQAREQKTQAQKIIENHMATGRKLSQQEALSILTEMSVLVNQLGMAVQQLSQQQKAMEIHITTASAREVTLFRLLKEKKLLFTEAEFKDAWQEFVIKPMEEKEAAFKKAQEDATKEAIDKVTTEAKEASLDAALEKKSETEDTTPVTEVQEPQDAGTVGEVSEVSEA